MRNEFDKDKDKKKTGQDEFGVILLDEEHIGYGKEVMNQIIILN